MNKQTITPNYERMREGFCHALQTAWTEYCTASNEYLTSMWFNEKGEICMLFTNSKLEKYIEAEAAFDKAYKDLNDFDAWVEMDKKMRGE